jgi:uncharacterized Zn finger protein (UPF0148 family)
MSEFDREAEREKLRKQFERDKERRRSTERMSELLLKGATMTNKHCDTCGSPIFRQNGQEFCPAEADGGHEGAQATEEGQQPDDQQPQPAPSESETEAEPEPADAAAPAAEEAPAPQPPTERPAEPRATPPAGDLAAARSSLARTLTRLATQAEDADDLGRTREYLAAAKEAAEALEATKRADR